jgi:hypothetical protein
VWANNGFVSRKLQSADEGIYSKESAIFLNLPIGALKYLLLDKLMKKVILYVQIFEE